MTVTGGGGVGALGAEKVNLGLGVEAFWPNLAVFISLSTFDLVWHL